MSHAVTLTVNIGGHQHHRGRNAQDFGVKSQDRTGRVVHKSEFSVGRECLAPVGSSASHNDDPAALTASVQKEDSGMINAEAMNSVTEKKEGRPSILTKDVMAGIPVLVQQGLKAEAIAARLGCTVGTLKVRCSQAQISLRVPKEVKVVPLVPLAPLVPEPTPPELPKQELCVGLAVPTTLQLSRVAMSRLRQRAEAMGTTEDDLVTTLIEVIAQDDLYDAVLDNGNGAA
jgi:hypothetical protein